MVALFITDRFAIKSIVGNFPYFIMGYCYGLQKIGKR